MKIKDLKQSFEDYIVGPSNRLAFAAARAVCENPKDKFNPLFICGEKGSGKTHLLKAIENDLNLNKPELKTKYFDLDFFNDLFIHAENEEELKIFRQEMREGDVFLYDNLDHLQKNESTKEEFFHTFNYIIQKGGQVVISSALNTKELDKFPVRLISRLEMGLTTLLLEPHFETRLLILEKVLEINSIKYDKAAIEELAQKYDKNISNLLEAVKDIIKDCQIENIELLTIEIVKNFQNAPKNKKNYDAQEIQTTVAKFLNVETIDLLSQSRISKIVEARHIAIYLMRRLTNYTLKEIGILFGRRHHTTIMHAEEEVKSRMEKDKNFNNLINKIIQQMNT